MERLRATVYYIVKQTSKIFALLYSIFPGGEFFQKIFRSPPLMTSTHPHLVGDCNADKASSGLEKTNQLRSSIHNYTHACFLSFTCAEKFLWGKQICHQYQNGVGGLKGDWSMRGFWVPQRIVVFDTCIFNKMPLLKRIYCWMLPSTFTEMRRKQKFSSG